MEPLTFTCEVVEIDGVRKAYVYSFEGTEDAPAVLHISEDES